MKRKSTLTYSLPMGIMATNKSLFLFLINIISVTSGSGYFVTVTNCPDPSVIPERARLYRHYPFKRVATAALFILRVRVHKVPVPMCSFRCKITKKIRIFFKPSIIAVLYHIVTGTILGYTQMPVPMTILEEKLKRNCKERWDRFLSLCSS